MSKLSVHYNAQGNTTGFAAFLLIAKPTWVYSLNGNIGPDIDRYSPETRWIYRRQSDGWQRLPQGFFEDDPVQNATKWLTVRPTNEDTSLIGNWLLNPATCFDPLNEPAVELPPNPTDDQVADMIRKAQYLNTWMITALEIAHQFGLPLALFSFPFGSPCFEAWEYLLPAMRLGKLYGAVLSLHAYTKAGPMVVYNPDGSISQDSLDWTLRHRRIYSEFVPEDAQLDIVYTEASRDNGFNVGATGQAWVSDFGVWDRELWKDRYVKGGCGFQLGGVESNLVSALPLLARHIADNPTVEPGPEPMPTLDIVTTEHLVPPDVTVAEYDMVQASAAWFKQDVLRSAGVARFVVQNSLPGSKVIVWGGSRWPGDIDAYLGVPTEHREFDEVVVPPFRLTNPVPSIPFRVTDPFNAPRDYANGLHEGIDLDSYNDVLGRPVDVVACAPGIVEFVDESVVPDTYGKTVIVNHRNGYKTWYCHLSRISVALGQEVLKGQILGVAGATGTKQIHLHLNVQHIGHGLAGYFKPDVIDPLPLIDYQSPPPPPDNPVPLGLHMSARGGDQHPADWDAFTVARMQCAKFMSNHAMRDIHEAIHRVGASRVYFRLYADPSNVGALKTGLAFFNVHLGWLNELYALGVYNWEIHNEPNIVQEGFGKYWTSARTFSDWYSQCALSIKQTFPLARVIYPGLSPNMATVAEWVVEIKRLIGVGFVDKIAAHSYWQRPGSQSYGMDSLDGGLFYQHFLNLGRSVVITEASNNNPDLNDQPKNVKAAQYVEWSKSLHAGVEAALFFVSSAMDNEYAHETWVGSQIPQIVGAR